MGMANEPVENDKASEKALSNDPQWLKLLHVDLDSGLSEVNSADFFLSPQGGSNPLAELIATIASLQSLENLDSDNHGQCRYPARYQWLKSKRILPETKQAACSAYRSWNEANRAESLSLVYATGYLDNPASFYGHLLLRLNTPSGDVQGHLLDTSIDFGAIIPDEENPVVYIARGLTGGYDAGFTQGSFYEQTQAYGDIELRDMWEYRLRLTPDETSLIVAHLWELQGHLFTYYYLTKNCAYRIVELVQLVSDDTLLKSVKGWIPPIDLIKRLQKAEHDGASLLEPGRFIPSRQKRFYNKYQQLSKVQQQALGNVIESPINLEKPTYRGLSLDEKMGVIDSLFDYFELRINQADLPEYQEAKKLLLQEMLILSSRTAYKLQDTRPPESPEKGQNSSAIRIALGHQKKRDHLRLGFRGSYFDLLNLNAGRMPLSQLLMVDVELQASEGRLQLERVDLLNIRTVSAVKSAPVFQALTPTH